MALIELNKVSKWYGKIKAIDNIDLSIEPGIIGLLGPNGAGKTTLFKLFLSFLPISSGKIRILNLDAKRDYLKIREKVGYMPERECFISGLAGFEIVYFSALLNYIPKQEAIKRTHEILSFIGFEEERYRLIDTYSLGMKQKIKLACALVHYPEILLLDEPTQGLDHFSRTQMLKLIKNMYEEYNITIILATHLLTDVEQICNDVILLNKGKVVIHDKLEHLKQPDKLAFLVRIKGEQDHFFTELKTKGFGIEERPDGLLKIYKSESQLDKNSITKELFQIANSTKVQIRHFEQYQEKLSNILKYLE